MKNIFFQRQNYQLKNIIYTPMRIKPKFLWIIIGILSSIKINIIGEIILFEALSPLYLIFTKKKIPIKSPILHTTTILCFVWSAMQLFSDLLNETDFNSSIKGVSAPLVFLSTFIALVTATSGDKRRILSFVAGVTIQSLISITINPTLFFLYEPWKWGYGSIVISFGFIYLASRADSRSTRIITIAFVAITSLISIYFNARTLATIPVAALILQLIFRSKKFEFIATIFRKKNGIFIFLAGLLLFFPIANITLKTIFTSDVFLSQVSEDAATKYKKQAESDVNILLAGRSEIYISAKAFLDSPLFGHGSWPKDKSNYNSELSKFMFENGISLGDTYATIESELIPAHSFIFGNLVWAGVFSSLIWIYTIYWTTKNYLRFGNRLPMYIHVGFIGLIWSIFFSPFGADNRWATSVFLSVFFCYTLTTQQRTNTQIKGIFDENLNRYHLI